MRSNSNSVINCLYNIHFRLLITNIMIHFEELFSLILIIGMPLLFLCIVSALTYGHNA